MKMLYDDNHLDFETKLKRYVHLEVLLKVLERDKRQLGHLKMAEVYEEGLDHIIDQILKDMADLRRFFRQSQGQMIQTVQLPQDRVVEYAYQGYRLKMRFLNEFMRVECGEILKGYMKLKSAGRS